MPTELQNKEIRLIDPFSPVICGAAVSEAQA